MIFQSFLLGNLVSFCMNIINSVVVVGLYYGFLTKFSIGSSYSPKGYGRRRRRNQEEGISNNWFYYGTAHDVHIDLLYAPASSIGPKMKQLQNQVQENVENMMSGYFQVKTNIPGLSMRTNSEFCFTKPSFIASCSTFGPKGVGLIVRIAALTTEPVYQFLRHQLACLEPYLGVLPYT